jgi:hypothetical protein
MYKGNSDSRDEWGINNGTELGENLFVRPAPDRQCGAPALFDGTMYLETDTSMAPVRQFQRELFFDRSLPSTSSPQ